VSEPRRPAGMAGPKIATAQAQPNIALIKYWGKLPRSAFNEPATGSLSITLDSLWTRTRVSFDRDRETDAFELNGAPDGPGAERVARAMEMLRREAGVAWHAEVVSRNNFPTGAGLASSASGFAALVVAVDAALGLGWSSARKASLARRLSGSAARSIFGGYVLLERDAGREESVPRPLLDGEQWPLEVVVAVVSEAEKATGSTAGMERSRRTSDYYPAWVDTHARDLAAGCDAVLTGDFEALAELAEASCLKMHALAMTSRPPLLYWEGATLECMQRIQRLRREGTPVFFTVDAGAQVKAVCLPGHAQAVAAVLEDVAGVQRTLVSRLGGGARVTEEAP